MTDGGARRRDSAATRRALLDAARKLFADKGFDRTTVRDIAAAAGVNQALLFRYFGSKEELLGAVLSAPGAALLADVGSERLLGELLTRLFAEDRERGHEALLMLALTGPGVAADTLRREVSEPFVDALSAMSGEPDARLRGQLVLAWILGVVLSRATSPTGEIAAADPEHARELMLTAIRALLERAD
ncbi:TetR family transcriptional regulator [Herbihabitans rhizosphaerae]|uniref:TetR family transcriptional regulator n=1 Tax=Herbihabitans rhizosphaerae TaxID=1872711 RepID=A0A4Q7L4E7_9PSEU|nr:TetR/AcrR family transcriptional regulator [Herbihabitans rhizosphaerae]RZS44498.1 TetR family transcriptional regulator [Herbihabitans rhizosphaerae]